MKLTREQSQRLLHERGIWITEACDRCSQLLGSVRWTRRGETSEWFSAECRDGMNRSAPKPISATVDRVAVSRKRIGARPAGRPKKHANNAEKCRQYRYRLKHGLATRNTPSQQIENPQVAGAKNSSYVVTPYRATQASEMHQESRE